MPPCGCILPSGFCLFYCLCHRLIPGFVRPCVASTEFGGMVLVFKSSFLEIGYFIALKTEPRVTLIQRESKLGSACLCSTSLALACLPLEMRDCGRVRVPLSLPWVGQCLVTFPALPPAGLSLPASFNLRRNKPSYAPSMRR